MKQIDRIRKMNAEELAEFIDNRLRNIDCDGCPAYGLCMTIKPYTEQTCAEIIREWLESEVEDEQQTQK